MSQHLSLPHNFDFNIQKLIGVHRLREDVMKFDVSGGNREKAVLRRMKKWGVPVQNPKDFLPEIYDARKIVSKGVKRYEETMVDLVEAMPFADWFAGIPGLGLCSYAQVLAETGSILNYPTVAKLWRRMGLAVDNGAAHKNDQKGVQSGYSSRRRMIMYRVSSCIVMSRNKYPDGLYQQLYVHRKQYEEMKNETGQNAEYVQARQSKLLYQFQSSQNKKLIKDGKLPPGVIDLRAKRYVEKALLRDLWNKWHGFESPLPGFMENKQTA